MDSKSNKNSSSRKDEVSRKEADTKKSNKKRKRTIVIAGVLILISIAATFLENV